MQHIAGKAVLRDMHIAHVDVPMTIGFDIYIFLNNISALMQEPGSGY